MPVPEVLVFISHASEDASLALRLVDLLRASLNLPSSAIRCTTVDGYRLPAGADTDEQLRKELRESPAFIGIISKNSLQSHYVLFELGARWGAEKHLIPLLAPDTPATALKGPLGGLNALRSDNSSQVHQLVKDVASILSIQLDSAASYQSRVEALGHETAGNAPGSRTSPVVGETAPAAGIRFKRQLTAKERETMGDLLSEAWVLLSETARSPSGRLRFDTDESGLVVLRANGQAYAKPGDRRSAALWRRAATDLFDRSLLEDVRGEAKTLAITDLGYQLLDAVDEGSIEARAILLL